MRWELVRCESISLFYFIPFPMCTAPSSLSPMCRHHDTRMDKLGDGCESARCE